MGSISKFRLLAGRKPADSPAAIAPIDAAAVDEDELPIPSDIKAVYLGGLFLLAVLAGCYVAAEIRVADRARLRPQARAAAGDARA